MCSDLGLPAVHSSLHITGLVFSVPGLPDTTQCAGQCTRLGALTCSRWAWPAGASSRTAH